ncbi:MAG TPA: cupin domain-containing protein [Crinalium sp.]
MTQSFWLFGAQLRIVADHSTTEGQYDLIEGRFLPGTQTPLHRHTRYSEQLYVLEGQLTVWAAENRVVLAAGENVLIPAGTPHTIGVFNNSPVHALVIAAPSSFARLIAAVGTQHEDETPNMALVEQMFAEIGDEILGPPGTLPIASAIEASQSV